MRNLIIILLAASFEILSPLAFAAEFKPQKDFSFRVDPIGTEYLRFQTCENGDCQGLDGGTGIYRIADLQKAHDDLTKKIPKLVAFENKWRRRLNVLGPAGLWGAFILPVTTIYFFPGVTQSISGKLGTLAEILATMTPFTFWLHWDQRPVARNLRYDQTCADYLERSLQADVDTESEFDLRLYADWVAQAVQHVPAVTEAEAGLTPEHLTPAR